MLVQVVTLYAEVLLVAVVKHDMHLYWDLLQLKGFMWKFLRLYGKNLDDEN